VRTGEKLRRRAWDLIEKGTAMRPTVGRDVHYVSAGSPVREDGTQQYPSTCRAAKITEVGIHDDDVIGLMVINPTGIHFHGLDQGGVKFAFGPCINQAGSQPPGARLSPGTWHWPDHI
jgi:hypothetical protein